MSTSHDDIWLAIDQLAERAGFSTSGLARKAGLDPTAFNRTKRVSPEGKPRWPSTESTVKVLSVTGVSLGAFSALVETREYTIGGTQAARTLPLAGLAALLRGAAFDPDGRPTGTQWDEMCFPDAHPVDDHACAVEAEGHTLLPLYRDGDILVVSPSVPMRKDDRVLVKTRQGEILGGEMLRKTVQKLEIKPFSAASERTLSADDVVWTARILWASQ